ncbi:hypothetical protein [Nocardioides limicola]|uniref:hypothetical protein n=1 Tax=Nocardioides limicola TaxID=2803368 RepID=UPI00193C52FA|nr:hypothetical protein [Nocardioides sp. DJM-14]
MDPVNTHPDQWRHHWREVVLGLRESDARRTRFPTTLHCGAPAVASVALAAPPRPDHDWSADIVGALIDRWAAGSSLVPAVWLVRPGALTPSDDDHLWLSATITAYAERALPSPVPGVDPTLVVVTRQGWFDPRTGDGRQWVRLRRRSPAVTSPPTLTVAPPG